MWKLGPASLATVAALPPDLYLRPCDPRALGMIAPAADPHDGVINRQLTPLPSPIDSDTAFTAVPVQPV